MPNAADISSKMKPQEFSNMSAVNELSNSEENYGSQCETFPAYT